MGVDGGAVGVPGHAGPEPAPAQGVAKRDVALTTVRHHVDERVAQGRLPNGGKVRGGVAPNGRAEAGVERRAAGGVGERAQTTTVEEQHGIAALEQSHGPRRERGIHVQTGSLQAAPG